MGICSKIKCKKITKKIIMKTKTYILFLFVCILFQSCKTQQLQTKIAVPKIENQLIGELDYAKGGFELVQWNKKGDEITLGKIDEKGVIHFSLPEYDIKTIQKNGRNFSFQSQFQMFNCKGKGEVDFMGLSQAKTPYDDIYYQMYTPIFIKKYDKFVANVYSVSDKNIWFEKNHIKIIGSNYYWLYVDRAIDYKDKCIKPASKDANLEISISADIQFKKGWNFIKQHTVSLQKGGENNDLSMPKEILYTNGSSNSSEVKWYIKQRMDEEKILAAKKEYELATPKTKK